MVRSGLGVPRVAEQDAGVVPDGLEADRNLTFDHLRWTAGGQAGVGARTPPNRAQCPRRGEHGRRKEGKGSGCYGGNGSHVAAADAAIISQLAGKLVRLQYSRADENSSECMSPATVHDLTGGLAGDGNVVGWTHEDWTPPHYGNYYLVAKIAAEEDGGLSSCRGSPFRGDQSCVQGTEPAAPSVVRAPAPPVARARPLSRRRCQSRRRSPTRCSTRLGFVCARS